MQLLYPVTASQRQRNLGLFSTVDFLEIGCILKCLHNYSKIRGYPKDILIQYILRGIGGKCAIAKK